MDVRFLQLMIPRHQAGVLMADAVMDVTDLSEVEALARGSPSRRPPRSSTCEAPDGTGAVETEPEVTLPGAMTPTARMMAATERTRTSGGRATSPSVERMLLALLSLAAAVVHVAVLGEHFAEYSRSGCSSPWSPGCRPRGRSGSC